MRDHRFWALVTVALLAAAVGWSQSNEIVDTLIAEDRATLGKAAYLALTAAGLVNESAGVEEAVADLRGRPWGYGDAAPENPVTLGSLSHLLMRAFDLKGGLLYSLFHGERYAAREAVYRGWVQGSGAPGRLLSGREVMHMVGKVLEQAGQREETEVNL